MQLLVDYYFDVILVNSVWSQDKLGRTKKVLRICDCISIRIIDDNDVIKDRSLRLTDLFNKILC